MRTFETATAENGFWENQMQKRAADEFYNDLFDATFADHTAKLAAVDPEYAAILHAEQEKQAFNVGFAEIMAQAEAAYDAVIAQGRK